MAHLGTQSLRILAIVSLCSFACGETDDEPDVPVVKLSPINETLTGDATIGFTVTDRESRLVNVTLTQGVGEAKSLATAAQSSAGLKGLETSPEGKSYTFTWDTTADLGYERYEPVFLSAMVSSGNTGGIGDSIGSIVVDNTSIERLYAVRGQVRRARTLLTQPPGDMSGNLYIGLWTETTYPPQAQPDFAEPLGLHALSSTAAAVPYEFATVPAASYQIIALLDDDNTIIDPTSYAIALITIGDLTNAGGTQIQLIDRDVTQDVELNYAHR